MTPRELQLAVDAAQDLNNKAVADVVGTARALTSKRRENGDIEFLLIDLAISVDLQGEAAQRLSLAHAALMDERALSARLQSGNEERR